ncbi:UNVERIFIED_CONTAM: protein argonaute 7 [Sesamum radiatum]|uniref:Protein argonaute 7 n=1 Tax=Sesamum radiatum TaxID=300843 RepID=A0AAW2M1C9_SESRA
MRSQTHRQEIIQDLCAMVGEILDDFYQELNQLPARIIFFRDGVSETQFHKVLEEELQAIRKACSRFPCYKPPITFAVVQKRHHTRLFPCEANPSFANNQFSDENVPPGTVVDTVITHPRDFDFYLCSHWVSREPAGQSIITSYGTKTSSLPMKCRSWYTIFATRFVRCTKPISLVPPAYYAHLAAYRGRLYLDRSDSSAFSRSCSISRASPPKAMPLPKLTENIRKLMFYC